LSGILQWLVDGLALVLLLPVAVLAVEVLAGVTRPAFRGAPAGERLPLAIVMPAHNEALGIAAVLRALVPQLAKSDRLLVVADNCSDDTAAIARAEGAEVIERQNAMLRGKGYALDAGIRHLSANPPQVVVIVDADCLVADGTIDLLSRRCGSTRRPIQALYLMRNLDGAAVKMRIAEFAWTIKNWVRPNGLLRFGLPCQLAGTGMAFPWSTLASAELATGHIVEDLKLGIDLARSGTPALFCPEALVTSCFPSSVEGAQSQRTRWEHGHIGVILSDAPKLFAKAIGLMNVDLLALALDLCVPPLALLTLLVSLNWLASALIFGFARAQFSLALMTLEAVLLGFSVLASWAKFGRKIISLKSLAFALVYAISKIPLYAKFLIARQLHWVRAKRDSD
jgi:cellulose synthase/poly-beta-1,6-N-acetylglucosamine synthase-like glycosyltransferase